MRRVGDAACWRCGVLEMRRVGDAEALDFSSPPPRSPRSVRGARAPGGRRVRVRVRACVLVHARVCSPGPPPSSASGRRQRGVVAGDGPPTPSPAPFSLPPRPPRRTCAPRSERASREGVRLRGRVCVCVWGGGDLRVCVGGGDGAVPEPPSPAAQTRPPRSTEPPARAQPATRIPAGPSARGGPSVFVARVCPSHDGPTRRGRL